MPIFRVFITRDTSETGTITVAARNADAARAAAMRQYHGEGFPFSEFFQPDDVGSSPYISDVFEEPGAEVGVNTPCKL